MSDGTLTAILALLCTSLLVRVLPAILSFKIPQRIGVWVENILPMAVFLNFVVYIFIQEWQVSPLAASISLIITGVLAYSSACGLLMGMLVGSLSYYLISTL